MNGTKVTYLVNPIPVFDKMIEENEFDGYIDQSHQGFEDLDMGQHSYKGHTFIVGHKMFRFGDPISRYVYKVHKEL